MNDYYEKGAMFPKPKSSQKRKKQNGWKDKENRVCYYTGQPNAERHEVFGGANRQQSIDMGFQVDLSPEIHRRFHSKSDEWARKEIERWQIYYQVKYIQKLVETGISQEQAMELWMLMIGKNYLW